jgi:hypothetical protein
MKKTGMVAMALLGLALGACEQRGTRSAAEERREATQARQEAREETAEKRQEAREEAAEKREERREATAEARQEGREATGAVREGVREVGTTLAALGSALGDAAKAAGDDLDDATVDERRAFVSRTKQTLAALESRVATTKPKAEQGSKELAADIRRLSREVHGQLDQVGTRSGEALDRTTDEVEKDLKELRARVDQANERGIF